jgi:hypothetical protein
MSTGYPNLEELLGGYFHQDWNTYASTPTGVLERYLEEWPIEDVPKALNELHALLAQPDDEVVRVVVLMGCEYAPAADNLSYREWLNQVANRLSCFLKNLSPPAA